MSGATHHAIGNGQLPNLGPASPSVTRGQENISLDSPPSPPEEVVAVVSLPVIKHISQAALTSAALNASIPIETVTPSPIQAFALSVTYPKSRNQLSAQESDEPCLLELTLQNPTRSWPGSGYLSGHGLSGRVISSESSTTSTGNSLLPQGGCKAEITALQAEMGKNPFTAIKKLGRKRNNSLSLVEESPSETLGDAGFSSLSEKNREFQRRSSKPFRAPPQLDILPKSDLDLFMSEDDGSQRRSTLRGSVTPSTSSSSHSDVTRQHSSVMTPLDVNIVTRLHPKDPRFVFRRPQSVQSPNTPFNLLDTVASKTGSEVSTVTIRPQKQGQTAVTCPVPELKHGRPLPPHLLPSPNTLETSDNRTPVPPLTTIHYLCYQAHRTIKVSQNKNAPVPCMVCYADDLEDRWRCTWCCVRMCKSCMERLQDSENRDLAALVCHVRRKPT